MIEINDIGVALRGKTVLRGCRAVLRTGTVTLLAGESKAGIRALVRAIAGVERYSGSIRFDGLENRAVRCSLYVSFDDARVVPYLDGFDNVRHLSGTRVSNSAIVAIAPELADRSLLRATAGTLSPGHLKRLHVVAALAAHARYVVFEDVTSGPGAPTVKEVMAALEQRGPDATVLLAGSADEFSAAPQARVRLLQTQDPIIT